jgi:hypothetical protein
MNIQPITLQSTTLKAIDLPFTILGGASTTDESVISTPLKEAGATGADNLDTQQRGAVIGEPIPIVFCRRVDGVGGVLISPAATEARFEDSAEGDITASYHLVLSEGQIDSIQVRDVFQRSCRVGSFSQTYGRRAGTFVPGNFIDDSDVEAPYYCGTGGHYTGLSTLAFTVTIPAGFDQWNRQVHCFVRGGMHVVRLLDSVEGPSNNVCDLLLYLLRNSSRVPEAQINTASLLAGATFTNANGFWFNGVVSESTNVRDWISDTLRYFLLRQSRSGGKEGLRPLLPTNTDGSIKTTAVNWEFTFTEEHIIPGAFEIAYTPLADRKPFCVMVLWRQQDDLGIAVMRTSEVRYPGTAEEGPFEQHDLSAFCSSEDHAVKVGTYILSKRRHVTHRLQIGVKPDAFNPTLTAGDLVRVRLDRIASTGAASRHDYLYEVDRIGKSVTGDVQLDLTHFPIDGNLASVVAQEVASATGGGLILPTGLTGITCDINSSSDTSVPADISSGNGDIPDESLFETEVAEIQPMDTSAQVDEDDDEDGNGVALSEAAVRFWYGGGSSANPKDALSSQTESVPSGSVSDYTYSGDPENPVVGDTVTAPEICEGGVVVWYRIDPSVEGGKVLVPGATSTYTMVINDIDYSVYAELFCPDPSSPTGYGEPIQLGPTPIIASSCVQIEGTVPPPGNTIGATLTIQRSSGTAEYVGVVNTNDTGIINIQASTFTVANVREVRGIVFERLANGNYFAGLRYIRADNVQSGDGVQVGSDRIITSFTPQYTLTWDHPTAVPYCL